MYICIKCIMDFNICQVDLDPQGPNIDKKMMTWLNAHSGYFGSAQSALFTLAFDNGDKSRYDGVVIINLSVHSSQEECDSP